MMSAPLYWESPEGTRVIQDGRRCSHCFCCRVLFPPSSTSNNTSNRVVLLDAQIKTSNRRLTQTLGWGRERQDKRQGVRQGVGTRESGQGDTFPSQWPHRSEDCRRVAPGSRVGGASFLQGSEDRTAPHANRDTPPSVSCFETRPFKHIRRATSE